MAIPSQSFTIRDDGLGIVDVVSDRFLFVGSSSSGDSGTIYTINSPAQCVDVLGQGPLSEAVASFTSQAGSCLALPITASVAGTLGSVTKTGVDASTGTITVAGTPNDSYEAILEVTTTGGLGAGEFRYSLDGGRTYSPSIVIPSGADYVIPNTGITATFVPGGGPTLFELGDSHAFAAVNPTLNATDVQTAVTAILAESAEFDVLVLCGTLGAAADAATLFAAFSAQLTTLETNFRFVGGIMDAASADTAANVRTGLTGVTSNRVMAAYGLGRLTSAKPFVGWSQPVYNGLGTLAARAALLGISGDLKRVASGPLATFTELTHDERTATTSLDDIGLTTFRTWLGRGGTYVTQGRIKSAAGSDFRLWPARRVMDRAAKTVYEVQQTFIGRRPRINPNSDTGAGQPGAGGTIAARDAAAYEAEVLRQLRAELLQPANADGTLGHVSDLDYRIDLAFDVSTNRAIQSNTSLVPLGTIDDVLTELSFTLTV
ncbi:MAG: DUF2586 family protein [Myxococcota bacterium]